MGLRPLAGSAGPDSASPITPGRARSSAHGHVDDWRERHCSICLTTRSAGGPSRILAGSVAYSRLGAEGRWTAGSERVLERVVMLIYREDVRGSLATETEWAM